MARYAKIDRRMWGDEAFRRLSRPQPNAQTLFVYLLSGPHVTNIPGVFCAGEAGLAEMLGWPLKSFREAFQQLSQKPLVKADWDARLVFVPNSIRYNPPASPNVVRSWGSTWDELPECVLKGEAYRHLQSVLEVMGGAFVKAFLEACGKPLANLLPKQKQKQEQEQDSPPTPNEASTGGDETLTAEEVQIRWNAIPGVKPCKALFPTVRDGIRNRLKEHPDLKWWEALFLQVRGSDFLTGRTDGPKGSFHASLDWILRPTNLDKLLAGSYDPAAGNGYAGPATCTKRIHRPGDPFIRTCDKPAVEGTDLSEPRCAEHVRRRSGTEVAS